MQQLKTFSPEPSRQNVQQFVSFDPVIPEDIPAENPLTRFSPVVLPDDEMVVKLAPLTLEDTKPQSELSSMAGPPYTRPREEDTKSQVSVSVSDTPHLEMVPFVDLGDTAPVTEAPQEPTPTYMESERIVKPVMVVQDLPEDSDEPAPMTKNEIIQMAVDRLKEMEDKMGKLISSSRTLREWRLSEIITIMIKAEPRLKSDFNQDQMSASHLYRTLLITEMMEVIKELQEDRLVVLEPVVEGDVIKVTNGPSMDGMNIIEFVEDENWSPDFAYLHSYLFIDLLN